MTDQRLTVDTFTTTTFDGYPVELASAVEHDDAIIYLSGLIKARISKTLPTLEAFALFNNATVLTYTEIRKQLDI